MKKIVFPLKPESDSTEIADLHAALKFFLNRDVLFQEISEKIKAKFTHERRTQKIGEATKALVNEFRKARNLTPSETVLVDETTADAINALLDKLGQLDTDSKTAADPVYKIVCTVVDGKGKPIAGLKVLAFDQDPNGIHDRLGEPAITTAEGYAEYRFKRSDFTEHPGEGNPDLFFQIYRGNVLLNYTIHDIHNDDGVIRAYKLDNKAIKIVVEKHRVITGTVSYEGGIPGSTLISDLTVQALRKQLDKEAAMGESVATDANGQYQIFYVLDEGDKPANLNLYVKLLKGDNLIASSPVRFNASSLETISLTIPGGAKKSEYEEILKIVDDKKENLELHQLEDEHLEFIANETRLPQERLTSLRNNARIAQKLGLKKANDPEVVYALSKQGLISNDDKPRLQPSIPAIKKGIESAIAMNQVSAKVKEGLDDTLVTLRNRMVEQILADDEHTEVSIAKVLSAAGLETAHQQEFLNVLVEHEGDTDATDDFWNKVSAAPGFSTNPALIDNIKLSMQMGILTGYHPGTIAELRKHLGDKSELKNLVKLKPEEWLAVARKAGVPGEIQGDTEDSRINAYATKLREQFEAQFPNEALLEQIKRADLFNNTEHQNAFNAYLKRNPRFDILKDSIRDESIGTGETPDDILSGEAFNKACQIQRIARLAPNTQTFTALHKAVYTSAAQIAGMTEGAFIARSQNLGVSVENLQKAHQEAVKRMNLITHLRVQYGREQNATNFKHIPPVLPPSSDAGESNRLMSVRIPTGAAAVTNPNSSGLSTDNARENMANAGTDRPDPFITQNISDWFGSQDFHACQHCRSVLSPAAYLTDLMHFFIDKETKQIYIDKKTNQVIGDVLINGNQVSGLDLLLAPNRRPDIQEILLNCKNAETPMPYIDLVNEILEQAVTNTTNLNYQTTWTAEELAANPEYVNNEAYSNTLAKAIYPLNLPFDLNAEEARIYLAHLGTSRHEIMETFWNQPGIPQYDEAIAREYLKLTKCEWDLLCDPKYAPEYTEFKYQLYELWGYLYDDEAIAALCIPQNLMQRASITLDELLAILKSSFVKGNADIVIDLTNSECLHKSSITINKKQLQSFCYFVRLWRVLGWSIAETNIVLSVFCPELTIHRDVLFAISHFKRLCDRLSLPVLDLLTLFGDLKKLPSTDYLAQCIEQNTVTEITGNTGAESFFEADFLNKKISTTDLKEFKDKLETEIKSESLNDYLPFITSSIGVSSQEISCLISEFDQCLIKSPENKNVLLDSNNLEVLYRLVTLSRIANISIQELIDLKNLNIIERDPLRAGSLFELPIQQGALSNNPQINKFFPILVSETVLNSNQFLEFAIIKSFALVIPWQTLGLLDELDFISNSGFTISELSYYLQGKEKPGAEEQSLRQNAVALQKLREELNKIDPAYRQISNITLSDYEEDIRSKLALLMESADVGLLMNWLNSVPQKLADDQSSDSDRDMQIVNLVNLVNKLKKDQADLVKSLGIIVADSTNEEIDASSLILYSPLPINPDNEEQRNSELINRYKNLLSHEKLLSIVSARRNVLAATIIKQQLTQILAVDPGITEKLLEEWLLAYGENTPSDKFGIVDFLNESFSDLKNLPTLVIEKYSELKEKSESGPYKTAFDTLICLRKAAAIISRLKLSVTEAKYLFSNQSTDKGWLRLADFSTVTTDNSQTEFKLYQPWRRLVEACQLNQRIGSAEQTLFDLFDLCQKNIPQSDITDDLRQTILTRTRWDEAGFHRLTEYFNITINQLTDERVYIRLERCFKLSQSLGVSIAEPWKLIEWLSSVDAKQASAIKRTAKAKYQDDNAWNTVAKPLQNKLRERKRLALVGYLCAKEQWTIEQLYSYFLIDPEMSACMMTSRIKQAISSVQLFIQRIFLGIEKLSFDPNQDIKVKLISADHANAKWEWLKNYRVWEANRKVILFPENWIYPELRDDKTPFFKELENELRQSELTDEAIEKAYLTYLNKLETVSNLEIVGHYYDEETDEYHVFGRTRSQPHVLYYRYRNNLQIWSPWEKINQDIQSDHLIPVVWNRRLYLFWPIFKEEVEKISTNNAKNQKEEPKKLWAIKMAWIVCLRSGNKLRPELWGWSSKEVTKDTKIINWQVTNGKKEPLFVNENITNTRYLYFRPIIDNNSTLKILFWYPNPDAFIWNWNFSASDVLKSSSSYNEIKPVINQYDICSSGRINFEIIEDTNIEFINAFHSNATLEDMSLNVVQPNSYVYFNSAPNQGVKDWFLRLDSPLLWGPVQGKFSLRFLNQYPVVWGTPFVYQDEFSTLTVWPEPYHFYALPKLTKAFIISFQTFNYKVERFYHPYVWYLIQEINRSGIEALLYSPINSRSEVPHRVGSLYRQSLFEIWPYFRLLNACKQLSYPDPHLSISFEKIDSFSIYNWEIFFHIPLLIADKLSTDQKFEEAMRWFHYIFDPLNPNPNDKELWKQPWRLNPFANNSSATLSIEQLLDQLNKGDDRYEKEVDQWSEDPFEPHLLARLRITPFMKTVVIKYIDNLIEWADQLFRRDTIESINEATQLYILASELLGQRPRELPERQHTDSNFANMRPFLDDLSNVMENNIPKVSYEMLELSKVAFPPSVFSSLISANANYSAAYFAPINSNFTGNMTALAGKSDNVSAGIQITEDNELKSPPTSIMLSSNLYFCIPQNEKLLSYWDTVADRLFKIRHCMNIEGIVRQLPLYEPPIDPGMLVKAKAAGIDFSTILNDLSAPAPHYRFNVMAQKASELCQEVKALGGALLSALEKRDGESLALLRSALEISLLEAVRVVRKYQIDETNQTLESLKRSKEISELKFQYYDQRISNNLIPEELAQLNKLEETKKTESDASSSEKTASNWAYVPDIAFHTGNFQGTAPGGMDGGPRIIWFNQVSLQVQGSYGGSSFVRYYQSEAAGQRANALSVSRESEMSGIRGNHKRRLDEWKHQRDLANKESKQIEMQITASEIRVQIAEHELNNHELQIENAKSVDEYMSSKFTNQELYDWMIDQIASVYHESYKLAYDTAKRAERAYRFELGLDDSNFISFGYWDSLRKGLLAGEKLFHDIKRMETAYLEQNKREYEITKHVSLALLDPIALISLRQTGQCFFDIPEAAYDLDCPGHFMRRIKSVSLTIPCVAGPYTSVNCTLTLLGSRARKKASITGNYNADGNYSSNLGALQSIVTSTAQNDSGLFELNFRDERYLPFEGAGAISNWRIELPKEFRQFDYDTISDVVLHIRYTAREGGEILKAKALENLKTLQIPAKNDLLSSLIDINLLQENGNSQGEDKSVNGLLLLSAKHDFSSEWYRFINQTANQSLDIRLTKKMFPYSVNDKFKNIYVNQVGIALVFVKDILTTSEVKLKLTNGKDEILKRPSSQATNNANAVNHLDIVPPYYRITSNSNIPKILISLTKEIENKLQVYDDDSDISLFTLKLSELTGITLKEVDDILFVCGYIADNKST